MTCNGFDTSADDDAFANHPDIRHFGALLTAIDKAKTEIEDAGAITAKGIATLRDLVALAESPAPSPVTLVWVNRRKRRRRAA
jgi:hypothetical protein